VTYPKKKTCLKFAALGTVLIAVILACALYLGNYYHADLDAINDFSRDFTVHHRYQEDNLLIFQPENSKSGLIFYPGGKVEHTAYIPLMEALASDGILCVLVEMPFRLAVLDMSAADGIQDRFPEITHWYLGGHSLGGAMAASYLSGHTEEYEGLILLAAYATEDLSDTTLQVLSVYGSEDRVMDSEKYTENLANLPSGLTEMVLDGGCHAYFGMYGPQEGDGTPTITSREQILLTAQAITNLIYNGSH
jgi:hypothetical protein